MMGRVVLFIVGLTLFGLVCVWQNLQNRRLQYDITAQQEELREQRRQHNKLLLDVERLRSPERLRKLKRKTELDLISARKFSSRNLTWSEVRDLLRKKRRYAKR